MTVDSIVYDLSSFGITGKSLRVLRNAIVDNIKDEIAVVQIQTDDILCGFLLLNKTKRTAVWSGDGFRTDNGGEGGRGYKAAIKMLDSFGLNYDYLLSDSSAIAFKQALIYKEDEAAFYQGLLWATNDVSRNVGRFSDFKCIYDKIPSY
jgi:hypothetical protein